MFRNNPKCALQPKIYNDVESDKWADAPEKIKNNMSRLRLKTKYSIMGIYGSTETAVLYCFHNDIGNSHVAFYDECGEIETMAFGSWVDGDDKWDAMNRLMFPHKDDGTLKDGVESASEEEMWQTK